MTSIRDLLMGAASGVELYSTCFGNVRYQKTLDDGNFELKKMSNGETFSVNVFGQIDYSGECVLFPAKDIKCWEGDWQSIVMPKSVGSVIVAGNGKTYAISKDCVLAAYPTLVGNDVPKDKFDFKNSRYANNVERAEFFEKAASYGFYWNADLCDFVGAKANKCVVCIKDIDTERTRSGEKAFLKKGTPLYIKSQSTLTGLNLIDEFGREFNLPSNLFRLWTIDDARDGDILCDNDTIFIFKEIDKCGYIRFYARYGVSSHRLDVATDYEKYSVHCKKNEYSFEYASADTKKEILSMLEKNYWVWDANEHIVWRSGCGVPKYKKGDRIQYNGDLYMVSSLDQFGYNVLSLGEGECSVISFNAPITPMPFSSEELQPYDKVLVRNDFDDVWVCDFFMYCEDVGDIKYYMCVTGAFTQCVPYSSDTENLLGTCDEYNGKYKTWNDGE